MPTPGSSATAVSSGSRTAAPTSMPRTASVEPMIETWERGRPRPHHSSPKRRSTPYCPTDLIGVFGMPDPAVALTSLGLKPCWHDHDVALGGAPVWTDAAGEIVVSGDLILDNADDLRRELGRPGAAAGELLAEL